MNAASSTSSGAEERALLNQLDALLTREEQLLQVADAAGLFALAEERERVTAGLAAAASARRALGRIDGATEAELVKLYEGVRSRHEIRAKVVRRFSDRTLRAVGVLAQASGRANVYGSDGRVQWAVG